MVDKFIQILQRIEDSRGPVMLFVLAKMDDIVDKWSIIISAPWTTPENRDSIFEEIRKAIIATLNSEELLEMSRLWIFQTHEHLVEELLKYRTGAILKDEKVNGNTLHFAHIIKSDPTVVSLEQSPLPLTDSASEPDGQ
jgi:hypothetical protein